MKYFIADTTIRDGEYEYFSQSPIKAKTEKEALKIVTRSAKEWTESDYREFEVSIKEEITKKEFDIVSKLIY